MYLPPNKVKLAFLNHTKDHITEIERLLYEVSYCYPYTDYYLSVI